MGKRMLSYVLVGLGGGLGAMSRYGVGVLVGRWGSGVFPMGTVVVNIAGSLMMGLFIGYLARATPEWQASGRLFAAVGFLGGFTTFSAFSLDVVTLLERGHVFTAIIYGAISYTVPVLALIVGLVVMRWGAM